MAIPELAAYVRQARSLGATNERIRQELQKGGWSPSEITGALDEARPNGWPTHPSTTDLRHTLQQVGERTGRAIRMLVFLFEALILLSIFRRYVGIPANHWASTLVTVPTDWAIMPWQPVVRSIVVNGTIGGLDALPVSMFELIPGGSLDIAGFLALIVYAVVYLILASLAKRLYHHIK